MKNKVIEGAGSSQESKSVLIAELKKAYLKDKYRQQFPSCAGTLWAARLVAHYGVILEIPPVPAIAMEVNVAYERRENIQRK